MITIQGKSISGHVAIGPLHIFRRRDLATARHTVTDGEAEIRRFRTAKESASRKLKKLYEEAVSHVGKDNAAIFQIQDSMLGEREYTETIEGIIRSQKVNAEYAVSQTTENFAAIYSSGSDSYMASRIGDLEDVSNILLQCLAGRDETVPSASGSYILSADDLSPSETIQLDKNKILGFITSEGNPNSHTAILARTLGVPAIVATGKEIGVEYDGHPAVIDGFTGTVYIDPDQALLGKMKEKQQESDHLKDLLGKYRGLPSVTKDGQKIELSANISSAGDIAAVMQNDAESIGLLRSEFIYMKHPDTLPTEEEQFKIYKLVLETMAGRKVIIRTVDVGADKQAASVGLPKEDNPALGMRAIRICFTHPEIFKTQLRAILRASVYGRASIMFPLITSVWEVWKAKEILGEVKAELDKEGIPYDKHMEVGIMVETPAAALISDKLAKEVDFFSIGTNDLSQYTLVVDRNAKGLSEFFNPHHPAVLKLVEMTIENAHKAGIWVGICGELASDLSMTETFLRMKVDELSVAPSSILPLRQKVRSLDLSK